MGIFRKGSLERLSSPEEMDQLMQITSARDWLALGAMLLLVAAGTVWCFLGAVSSSVSGQGAIVRRGGVRVVVTTGTGVLAQLNVHPGEHIHSNQVVAQVEQPATAEKLQLARQRLAEAEAVRQDTLRLNTAQAHLQLDTIRKRRQNAEQQMATLKEEASISRDQITIQEGLQAKGLVTRRQVLEARHQVAALETELANREAEMNELESDRFAWERKPSEADELMREKNLDLASRVTEIEKEAELEGQVVSPYDGEVVEIKAYAGQRVDAQTPILSIQPSANNLEVVGYIPSLRAQEVRSGMEVQISPSIVKREEYGFLRGQVVEVGAFPVTRAALMRNFENENLLTAFANDSPVTELHIEMRPDSATSTGFVWSSSKGPPIQLSAGMLCSVQIVTLRQRPVELILPFLRRQSGAD